MSIPLRDRSIVEEVREQASGFPVVFLLGLLWWLCHFYGSLVLDNEADA